jgi:folate-binding protein YgfZ
VKDAVLARLDQFIFAEDVKLGDVTEAFSQYAVVGPRAAGVLAGVLTGISEPLLAALPDHGNLRGLFDGQPAIVARVTDTGERGFDIFVERGRAPLFLRRLQDAGAASIDPGTAEAVRIEAGVPVFHRDMDEDTIPLEAGIEGRAISLTKGCYVGQEVIIRVLHRGHGRVARRLVGLAIEGRSVPPPAAKVRSGDREIGHVTSATMSPALNRPIALAYVHRDFVEPGTRVVIDEPGVPAVVSALPFVHGQV